MNGGFAPLNPPYSCVRTHCPAPLIKTKNSELNPEAIQMPVPIAGYERLYGWRMEA
jgi:hypothetical protein